jgi:glycine cleavage system H protein
MATVESYEFPADRWYEPREHVWVRPEPAPGRAPGVVVTVGVDALGQELLGEVVYVQLDGARGDVRRGDALGSLEADKMVRPVLAPLTGAVLEVNAAVLANPRLLNRSPYDEGWLVRLRATRWDLERGELIHGDEAVTVWARAELGAGRR